MLYKNHQNKETPKSIAFQGSDDTIDLKEAREWYLEMERNKILERYTFPTEPSSDGRYHIWLPDDTNKSGRRNVAARTLAELKDKVYAYEKGINGSTLKTFKDVFELVQEEKLRYCKDPEKRLSIENTIIRNRSEYARFFEGTDFASRFVADISKKDIEAITLATLNKYDLKKKGFASFRSILKSVFKLAFEEHWIEDQVYDRVNFDKFKDMIVRDTPVEERLHSDDDMVRILEFIHQKQSKKPNYLPAYALELQILMGLRRGEIPPLMWDDIKNGYIEISKEQITNKKTTEHPKETFTIVHHTKTWKALMMTMY